MIYNCCGETRRNAILGQAALGTTVANGIDYLEVLDKSSPKGVPRQQTLFIHCLYGLSLMKPVISWKTDNVMIEGGESITNIAVSWVVPASSVAGSPQKDIAALLPVVKGFTDIDKVVVIRVDEPGDFSTYRLRLVNSAVQAGENPFEVTETLAGFDPQLAAVDFSFKVECDLDFDCAPPAPNCPPAASVPPPINYLAKDYGSFRSVILDRLSQLLPSWGGGNEADMAVVLAELVAYAGDQLSYKQDAVATEAYLETARSRVSLRRHARLVDYFVRDGANARAWIQLLVAGNPDDAVVMVGSLTRFYTNTPGGPSNLAKGSGNEEEALLAGVTVFEPMQDATLYPKHNQISFYTWGDTGCCLPQGATEATLSGYLPNLQPGDVLIFQEVLGPQTGDPADADIRHRCAVRLAQVTTRDGNGDQLADPLFNSASPAPVTEVQWSADDALPFPVCISSTYMDDDGLEHYLTDVSVAYGNVVLADNGLSIAGTKLGTVPEPVLFQPPDPAADRCNPTNPTPLPVRFRPPIPDAPLTQAAPLPLAGIPVTPGIVALGSSGSLFLSDAGGLTSLMVQSTQPDDWPQYISVVATANGANFDLQVTYQPPGGAHGVSGAPVLETFKNLSVAKGDPNYAPTQINALSNLIQVPASYNPPSPSGTGFSSAATALSNSGPVSLANTGTPAGPFLTLQAASPAIWPLSFGVLSQSTQPEPPEFNLVVVYNPPSGAVGVLLPVTVEQFAGLSLGAVSVASNLITVDSFGDTPNLSLSASDLMDPDPAQATPSISLASAFNGQPAKWTCLQDMLESSASDKVFVVEVDTDGTATLRFGDNVNGMRPDSGMSFVASYRIGNGTAGNVGADSLTMLAVADARIQSCRNPLPATGGTDPETNDQIRRRAPQAFLTQERAVTMADYAAMAELNPQVDRAVSSLRWTGSWYTVFTAVEPVGGGPLTKALSQTLEANLERYRLAGQDLAMDSPQYVSLQIELQVCVDPDYFAGDVETALMRVLGSGTLPGGATGFFYADNFTFGQTVYLSPIYAAARAVAGVVTVTAKTFQPQGPFTAQYLDSGEIPIGPLQVAQLANDPSLPDHGTLKLDMEGGK